MVLTYVLDNPFVGWKYVAEMGLRLMIPPRYCTTFWIGLNRNMPVVDSIGLSNFWLVLRWKFLLLKIIFKTLQIQISYFPAISYKLTLELMAMFHFKPNFES